MRVSGGGAIGHAHLRPAITMNPTAIEECSQKQAETLSLHLLPEVRGNVNSFEFEHVQCDTVATSCAMGYSTS